MDKLIEELTYFAYDGERDFFDITRSEAKSFLNGLGKKDDEIERLNNIINELEKELDRGYRDLFAHELVPGRELITNIKNYLEELKKEVKNNE